MPTYQYVCTACDERLEAVQTFTDAPLTECRVCGGTLRKVFSAVGVVFKGSGFYKTDSRSKATSGSSSSGEGKSEGKSDSKGDAKPAAASADKGSSSSSTPASSSSSSTPASKTA